MEFTRKSSLTSDSISPLQWLWFNQYWTDLHWHGSYQHLSLTQVSIDIAATEMCCESVLIVSTKYSLPSASTRIRDGKMYSRRCEMDLSIALCSVCVCLPWKKGSKVVISERMKLTSEESWKWCYDANIIRSTHYSHPPPQKKERQFRFVFRCNALCSFAIIPLKYHPYFIC